MPICLNWNDIVRLWQEESWRKIKKSKKYKEIVEKYRNDEIERREFEEYLDRLVGCAGVTLHNEPTPAENCMAFDFGKMEWFNPADYYDSDFAVLCYWDYDEDCYVEYDDVVECLNWNTIAILWQKEPAREIPETEEFEKMVEKYRNKEIELRDFERYLDKLVGSEGVTFCDELTPVASCLAFEIGEYGEVMEWFDPFDFYNHGFTVFATWDWGMNQYQICNDDDDYVVITRD